MMSDNVLKELYGQAIEEDFIQCVPCVEEDYWCNGDCERCPAKPACRQLSIKDGEQPNYGVFLDNYRKLFKEEFDDTRTKE